MTEWIVTSTVLAALVIAARYALRGRISLRLQYGLWLLVLLRLLIPVSFGGTSVSVANVAHASKTAETLPQAVVTYVGGTTPQMSISEPDPTLPAAEWEAQYEINKAQWQQEMDSARAETGKPVSVGDILLGVWIGGGAVLAGMLLWSNVRFGRRLRRNRTPLKTTGKLPVYVTEAVETPCLFGLFRPAVYVTPEAAADPETLDYALAHEETHYHHGDHIWSALRCLCLVVHWYNPVVWWAAMLSRRDGELACDEAAIARLGEGRRVAYGRALIDLSCEKRTQLLVTATTMTGSARGLKERIQLIARRPKTTLGIALAVVLLTAVAVGCTFTGAAEEKTPEPETTETEEENRDDPTESAGKPENPTVDAPQAVLDWAEEVLAEEQRYYEHLGANPAAGGGYTVTGGQVTGLTEISLGAEATDLGLHMYLLEYRITPDDPEAVELVGGMRMEDGAITEWAYDGQPYLLLRETGEGWTRLGSMSTDRMAADYGSEELTAQYGDLYTAAAVEFSQGRGCGQEKLAQVLAALPETPVRIAILTDIGVMTDFDGSDNPNASYLAAGLGNYAYAPMAGHIAGGGVRIQLLNAGEGEDWSLIYFDDSPYMALTTGDYDTLRFCAVDVNGYDGPVGDVARLWCDEVEFLGIGGGFDNQGAIVIPDEGQGYLAAAQEFCQTLEEKHLEVTDGSAFKFAYVQCLTEAAEDTTAAMREYGDIGENTWAFTLTTIFVPENQNALDYAMAGNTTEYDGGDPAVPEGAWEYFRCGYMTLEADGWHGGLVGTGW